jgi:L-ribulose-5-phosphate 3-epimerase
MAARRGRNERPVVSTGFAFGMNHGGFPGRTCFLSGPSSGINASATNCPAALPSAIAGQGLDEPKESQMTPSRRDFIARAGLAATAVAAGSLEPLAADRPTKDDISLAAWSINRSFFVGKKWKLLDLPRIVRTEFAINGIELVNQFFENPMMRYLQELKGNAVNHGVKFVLIMVDGEGDMIATDKKERMQAAIAHRKWIDIASFLGCHAIRCNLGGNRTADWKADKDLVSRAAESFSNLLEYAKGANLNVVLENHGGASSDPDVMVAVMKAVNNPNFGTLPDFGNVNPGDDHAAVLRKIVPYAKGISVKASWQPDGTHNKAWDLEKMIAICQESGYHGFWGIESSYGLARRKPAEGAPPELPQSPDLIWDNEIKGVRLTRDVLERLVIKKT